MILIDVKYIWNQVQNIKIISNHMHLNVHILRNHKQMTDFFRKRCCASEDVLTILTKPRSTKMTTKCYEDGFKKAFSC